MKVCGPWMQVTFMMKPNYEAILLPVLSRITKCHSYGS